MSKKYYLKSKFPVISLCIVSSLVLSSCGLRDLASGRIAPPKVEFQGLTISPPAHQSWPLTARLRLQNPNPEPLRILGYDYEVTIAGVDLVQGESSESLTLPADGESVVEIPVLLQLPAIPKAFKALLLQDKLKYEISGGFRLASVLGGLRIPFRFQKEITRQESLERLRELLPAKRRGAQTTTPPVPCD
jgi:LEA14-like dessication related protein